jgi:hypothetical protein
VNILSGDYIEDEDDDDEDHESVNFEYYGEGRLYVVPCGFVRPKHLVPFDSVTARAHMNTLNAVMVPMIVVPNVVIMCTVIVVPPLGWWYRRGYPGQQYFTSLYAKSVRCSSAQRTR